MNKTQSLANALIERQILSPSQVDQAQQHAKGRGGSLDQALVELGLLSAEDLAMIYNDVLQVRSLKLEDVEIDRDAVRHVPAAVARRFHLIPVRRSGNTLAVAMADPSSADALGALKNVTDFDIIPFVARYDAIEHALFVHYGEPTVESGDGDDRGSTELLVRPRALLDENRASYVGKSIQLNRGQTFESFVVDPANDLARNLAKAICEGTAEDGHNPFHCWGATGSGKTHLLHAMANHLSAHFPLKRYVLTTAQRFADDLFQSIRDKKINFFRYLYRELDMLIIDDAEALLWRDWAQRELIETYRHLRGKGRRLVIAASRNLAADPRVVPELRAELESGVVTRIGSYSQRGKLEIAQRCMGNVRIAPDTLARAVQATGDNLAELIMLLQHLTVVAVAGEGEVSADLAEDLIQLYGAVSVETPPTLARAAATAAGATSTRSY